MDATEDEPTSFIYLSSDALSNPSKLLVLIQGSGVVRAGQWARRLIINQDLDSGTQIPFITRAMEVGAQQKQQKKLSLFCWMLNWFSGLRGSGELNTRRTLHVTCFSIYCVASKYIYILSFLFFLLVFFAESINVKHLWYVGFSVSLNEKNSPHSGTTTATVVSLMGFWCDKCNAHWF